MFNRFIRITALLMALMLTLTGVVYAEDFSALVNVSRMNVYSDYAQTKKLGTLKKNAIITVLEAKDGMAKFTYDGRVGYSAIADMVSIAEIADEVTVQTDSRVYRTASKAAKSVKISAGTEVYLLDTQGSWAAIERDGNLGFLPISALEEQEESEQPDADIIVCDFQAMVDEKKVTVRAAASANAKKLGTMKKGTVVTVLAYDNAGWAYIDLEGHRGFVQYSGLTKNVPASEPAVTPTPAPTATPTPTATPAPTATPVPDYNSNSKYTNEQIIYAFLIKECGFNSAAACGVLANIRAESNFNPTSLNSIGCYGICQWYKGRRTRLNNFCEENGYDSASLEGQLWYLKYELQNHYKGTWNYLHGVENTADGAYDAAYYWCYYFEIPGNRTANSIKRGNSARDTYWPKYN